MASLKEQLDAAGFDVSNFDEKSVLKQLADAGYDISQYEKDSWMNKPENAILAENYRAALKNPDIFTEPDKLIKSGLGGIADITTGQGLQQAATDIEKIKSGEKPETTPAKVGEFIGELVTPEQIAMQGVGEAALSKLGPWATDLIRTWGEKAALSAITGIKTLAKAMGLENLSTLAQFVLHPVQVGGKELPAIVTATNTTKDMLAAAQAIKDAAGVALGKISPAVDEALAKNPGAINLKTILEDLDRLSLTVKDIAPKLGKAVVNQYESAIEDFLHVVKTQTLSDNPELFTALRKLKTTIGDLVFKHGSPLESKAALEDAYAVLSKGIDSAAHAAGEFTGAAFDEANAVYNKAYAIVESLTGKSISEASKGFFADLPAWGAATIAGTLNSMLPGPLSTVAVPAAFMTAKAAQAYGPQAIAAGLSAVAPAVGPALQKGIPLAARTISAALGE